MVLAFPRSAPDSILALLRCQARMQIRIDHPAPLERIGLAGVRVARSPSRASRVTGPSVIPKRPSTRRLRRKCRRLVSMWLTNPLSSLYRSRLASAARRSLAPSGDHGRLRDRRTNPRPLRQSLRRCQPAPVDTSKGEPRNPAPSSDWSKSESVICSSSAGRGAAVDAPRHDPLFPRPSSPCYACAPTQKGRSV